MGRAGTGDEGGGGEQPDTGDLTKTAHIVAVFGEVVDFALDMFDALFEFDDFVEEDRVGRSEGAWEFAVPKDSSDLAFGASRAFGDGVAEFSQEST